MTDLSNLAIIGSGPTSIYLLQYIWSHIDVLHKEINSITIFEKENILGMGMPYSSQTTDIYNLSNISSEEIPLLHETFGDWLRKQNIKTLKKLNIDDSTIDDSEVYSRIALGNYFQAQYKILIKSLQSKGIQIIERCNSEVIDIKKEKNKLIIIDCHQTIYPFTTIVIANGHEWSQEDHKTAGYYASPWPIHKILPAKNELYNFPVGTLGASLSAFDVVTSLSHRHGKFERVNNKLRYFKNESVPNFKIVLHSSKGWLPQLQYEQQKPIREIYRHFHRDQLLALIDDKGFLRIEDYFNYLCRPALITAFTKDKLVDVVERLKDKSFSFKELVALMSEKHNYVNSFEGMRKEMAIAKNSVYNKIPIYWMETLDDLMYSLNFHAELLAAEDHLFFHQEVMSFLMNVIAALPLQSAEILLALYEAKCIALKAGSVSFPENAFENNKTIITVEAQDGTTEEMAYNLFINCGGHKKLEIEDYPFQSLVKDGVVHYASVKFQDEKNRNLNVNPNLLIKNDKGYKLKLGGIDIDSSYRTVNKKGVANHFLFDINFTHSSGLRPYSYGLQACSATSLILIESWIAEIVKGKDVSNKIENITELYEDSDGL